MPRKKALSLRCPTCRKIVLRDEADFPFCSERCRLIDLGKWASEGYVISSPVNDPEDVDAIAEFERRRAERRTDGSNESEDKPDDDRRNFH
jgi:endogenous inhibitor of DNA gyrase (YacG/DUF329 family)